MKTYLLNWWDWLRTSYWFVPSLIVLGALLCSWGMPVIDHMVDTPHVWFLEWAETTTDTARSTLSAIAGAMFAVTGTVFSITVVTLSLASQQFGPRLLRRFMFDLTTQVTLGIFLATSLYCLLMIRLIDQPGSVEPPYLSVAVAVGFSLVSMAMLIVFIHHIATLIQAPQVVAAVACDLDSAIQRIFPERIGEPYEPEEPVGEDREWDDAVVIRSNKVGYIQAFAAESLVDWAVGNSLIVRLLLRPGDFVSEAYAVAEARPEEGQSWSEAELEELAEEFNASLIVGARRTPRQDVECAVDELVEVAVRSLSPGINDPFTAINCIDRLGASLSRLTERDTPLARRSDADGRLRVIARPITFADVLDAAFNQIRHYGRGSAEVLVRMLDTLQVVATRADRPEHLTALRRHAEMIRDDADVGLQEEADRIAARYREVIDAVETSITSSPA